MQPYMLLQATGSDVADEWIRLGIEHQIGSQGEQDKQKRVQGFARAEGYYRQALRLRPNHAVGTHNLAVLYAQLGNMNEALLAAERAAMYDGKMPGIHVTRAFMALEGGRIDEALDAARYAVSIASKKGDNDKQDYLLSRLALAMVTSTAGYPEESVSLYEDMLSVDPKHPLATANLCFAQSLSRVGPKELCIARRGWYEANKVPENAKKPHNNDRDPERPLRIGYVGGDFKQHSASMIFGSVVLHHDQEMFKPYLYSSLPVDGVNDVLSKRFKEAAGDRWRDVFAMNDDDLANKVREDKIDILVDLAAHTAGNRLALFCRKPAPVQVHAWGFAHGSGVPEVDYFLADPVAIPQEEREHYVEKIFDVPCIVSYEPRDDYQLKGTSPLPYFANDEVITFGAYSRYEKTSDYFLEMIAQILTLVPNSRIEFKDFGFNRPYSIKRVLKALAGIENSKDRILFSIATSHRDHLLAYQQADLCLDPWPHGGGVVTLEQLWMGVPLITLYGPQASGRTAASVLTAMGRQDWVARDPNEYVMKAVALANDIPALQKARKTLRQEFLDSPVIKGYPQAVEAAYRTMWKEWCQR